MILRNREIFSVAHLSTSPSLTCSAIVDKIDSDNDGQVTEHEMVAWIKYIQRRYVTDDAKLQWQNYGKKDGGSLSWDEYENRTFGGLTSKCPYLLTCEAENTGDSVFLNFEKP